MNMELNEALARKVLTVVDAGLVSGMGEPIPGKMCVEAAVNYAMGAPHGDQPACVAPVLRALKIKLNDSPRWSSDAARTKGLRRLAIAQLGSAGSLDEKDFSKRVATLAIQHSVPEALRAAAKIIKDPKHRFELLKSASLCESYPTRGNAVSAGSIARAAADAAAYAYGDAAAYADAAYAADAADAAADAADAAADAAAYADAADAADAAAAAAKSARDKSLADFCERVVQILIDMKAPGCQWLWLTEDEAERLA